jgi:hypothetical protein
MMNALSSPLPSSGYGLLRAIREAEILAREMAGGFASGRISYEPAIIEARYPGFELHYLASDMLKNINDPLLDKSIRQMNRIDPAFIAHFLRGDDLSIIFSAQMISAIYETFSLQEIASMALRHDYKEFLLHIVRIYPKATPAVIKKTMNSLVSRLFKKR